MNRARPRRRGPQLTSFTGTQDYRGHAQIREAFSNDPRANLQAAVWLEDGAECYEQRAKRNPVLIIFAAWDGGPPPSRGLDL